MDCSEINESHEKAIYLAEAIKTLQYHVEITTWERDEYKKGLMEAKRKFEDIDKNIRVQEEEIDQLMARLDSADENIAQIQVMTFYFYFILFFYFVNLGIFFFF